GRGREDDIHRRACLGQPARQRTTLVAGDSARHAKHNVTAGNRHQASCWRRRRTKRYLRPPRTSSSNARVVSFSSQSTDRSRGKSFTKRANLAATRTPRYLFCVCPATSAGVMIRIASPFVYAVHLRGGASRFPDPPDTASSTAGPWDLAQI